jgi:hypothetical protein
VPSGCPGGCDDGDPCTTDVCAAAVCAHEPLAGFAAACSLCRAGFGRPACAGVGVPGPVARKIAQGCQRHGQALATPNAKRQRRLGRRALASLAKAVRATRKTADKGKLPANCVGAVAESLAPAP